ncbi:lipid asymmetry maintenance protein MlaB [Polynucleobacter sp. AP-Feld-500C-C5]|uniref:STAS domain-containing protein n=1 Tax=Polynucleobacter sp. AP-Feld-500C-C5 TaxID=2576924 RepID=UPI001C0E46F4|nr:STAS domain-containing protein [Polynucleobacter sp. AP-Feld-500C-C5]MBU3631817.1 STAS domain-containing protein [Polynucleobacter sp. AP-Feld-500C-C5]
MPFLLPQTVTQENALQLQKEGLLNSAALTNVDCSALTDFDSTVLTVLLAWQKKLQADGQSLIVERPPEKLKVLANVYGVSALLGL